MLIRKSRNFTHTENSNVVRLTHVYLRISTVRKQRNQGRFGVFEQTDSIWRTNRAWTWTFVETGHQSLWKIVRIFIRQLAANRRQKSEWLVSMINCCCRYLRFLGEINVDKVWREDVELIKCELDITKSDTYWIYHKFYDKLPPIFTHSVKA